MLQKINFMDYNFPQQQKQCLTGDEFNKIPKVFINPNVVLCFCCKYIIKTCTARQLPCCGQIVEIDCLAVWAKKNRVCPNIKCNQDIIKVITQKVKDGELDIDLYETNHRSIDDIMKRYHESQKLSEEKSFNGPEQWRDILNNLKKQQILTEQRELEIEQAAYEKEILAEKKRESEIDRYQKTFKDNLDKKHTFILSEALDLLQALEKYPTSISQEQYELIKQMHQLTAKYI